MKFIKAFSILVVIVMVGVMAFGAKFLKAVYQGDSDVLVKEVAAMSLAHPATVVIESDSENAADNMAGADATFEKKFTVKQGGVLEVDTDAGSIAITGSNSNEVSVTVRVRASDEITKNFLISAEQKGDDVRVNGKIKGGTKQGGRWGYSIDAEFIVAVPRNYNLKLSTSGGSIDITGITGKLKGNTSGGGITVKDITGETDMQTSGGSMRAEKITGNLNLETSGGSIRLNDVRGDVAVETSGGGIEMDEVEGKIRAETSGGGISISLRGENKGIYAETSAGGIDLTLPKNTKGTIDAQTSVGQIVCEMTVMNARRDEDLLHGSLRGDINGGGNKIHAHTSAGSVRIKTR
ncbi:MAG: DUF4097 family beta strand repeat protein [Rhizobacter sp.]|nr:DUF4097 family beta strand repeat protein [Chlorobiales bacterium]